VADTEPKRRKEVVGYIKEILEYELKCNGTDSYNTYIMDQAIVMAIANKAQVLLPTIKKVLNSKCQLLMYDYDNSIESIKQDMEERDYDGLVYNSMQEYYDHSDDLDFDQYTILRSNLFSDEEGDEDFWDEDEDEFDYWNEDEEEHWDGFTEPKTDEQCKIIPIFPQWNSQKNEDNNFVNLNSDVLMVIEEHLSQLIKLKVITRNNYNKWDESFYNYLLAEAIHQEDSRCLYLEQFKEQFQVFLKKLKQQIDISPEVLSNPTVKDIYDKIHNVMPDEL